MKLQRFPSLFLALAMLAQVQLNADTAKQPHEQNNLISNPEYAAVIERLRGKTRDLHAEVTE